MVRIGEPSIYYSPFTIYQHESPALNNAGLS